MRVRLTLPTIKLRITSETMFALLISVMLCHYTFFDYFAVIIGKLPIVSIFRPFFFPVLYSVLCVFSIKTYRLKCVKLSDILLIIAITLAILISIIIYPDNAQYIIDVLWTAILPCLPFFLIGLCIDLNEKTYKTVSTICCLAILVSALYRIVFISSGGVLSGSHGEDYSMYNSYLLLPNTLIAIDYFGKSRKKLPAVCSVVGIIYAFAMGTRGPIVILAAHIVICIWRYTNFRTNKKVFFITVLGILTIAFVSSPLYIQTLLAVRDALLQNGVSARVIDYMISGEMISQTSGRNYIYADLLGKLSQRPIIGYGLYGEYSFGYLAGAHSIYLQLVFQLGYPLGVILLISYIGIIVNAYMKTKGQFIQGWIVVWGCLVFIRGIFGGSLFDSAIFFLLGMCLNAIRKAKRKDLHGMERRNLNDTQSVYCLRKIL